jgi:excisionase family DNA binding protein
VSRLTVRQAAQRAGVSTKLIYQWTTGEKRLPHFRLGGKGRRGKVVIESEDLDAFLAAQKVEGGTEPPPAPKPATPLSRHLKL